MACRSKRPGFCFFNSNCFCLAGVHSLSEKRLSVRDVQKKHGWLPEVSNTRLAEV